MTRRKAFGALAIAPLIMGTTEPQPIPVNYEAEVVCIKERSDGWKTMIATGVFIFTFADGSVERIDSRIEGFERIKLLVARVYGV